MNKTLLKIYRDVLSLPTAPYHERVVADFIRAFAKRRGIPVKADRYGNLVVRYRRGNRPKRVALAGHMDHPGFEVLGADGRDVSAQWYGAQIVRYDPDGKVERRIAMPVKQVSSLTFGGKDLTDLYVTSAGASWPSSLMPPGYDPEAPDIGGALYRIRLDVQGKPEHQAGF